MFWIGTCMLAGSGNFCVFMMKTTIWLHEWSFSCSMGTLLALMVDVEIFFVWGLYVNHGTRHLMTRIATRWIEGKKRKSLRIVMEAMWRWHRSWSNKFLDALHEWRIGNNNVHTIKMASTTVREERHICHFLWFLGALLREASKTEVTESSPTAPASQCPQGGCKQMQTKVQ